MSSKKIEERNEKIIRGLMKLPPNRRCINCNSLGPQYVCTNFWTFVCTTCSGIHREFTHRVKSVSMAKFTSQEVEALQEGGNQRAREIYLKDWDLQRQRLPDSSNVDKIRDFIKAIYVDYKYAGGKASDKPSRDTQDIGNHEGDTRRASSYHSYSQSPPYEYQYEERRYGRQAGALNRKPGSDRALERKISSFIYSPGRYEDRFANENSGSRISDYSVSSAGDPVRSGNQSPNSQKSFGFGSPPVQPVRDILNEDVRRQTMNSYSEANARRDVNGVPRPQRTTSSGSFGSSDSNSMSSKSVSSGSLFDVISEPEQSVGSQQDKIHSSPFSQSSVNTNVSSMDLFASSFVQLPATSSAPVLDLSLSLKTSHTPSVDLFQQPTPSSALSIDLFQQPSSAPSIDLFQQPSSAPSIDLFQQSAPSSAPAIDLFASSQSSSVQSLDMFANIAHQQSATKMLEKEQSGFPTAENEGWATFDSPPQVASTLGTNDVGCPTRAQAHEFPAVCLKAPASTNTGGKLQPVPSSAGHGLVSPASGLWHGATQALASTSLVQQSWNAFGGSVQTLSQSSFENITQSTEPHVKSFTGPISTQSWDAFQDSTGSVSQTSFGNPPHTNELQGQGFSGQTSTQPWNAFEDPADRHSLASFENLPPKNEPQPLAHNPAAATDQYLSSKVHERPSDNGFQRIIMEERAPMPSGPVNSAVAASSFTPSVLPLVGGPPMYGADRKSTNPFDISYDSDLEPNSMLLDMSSLQATLPNPQLPPAFLNQPWFPQNTGTPYIPTAPQGVLPYMGGQATSPRLQNIAAQSPVAPLGGNPFA